eukprot:29337-Pelagococcus_subviridis.AAC.9
MSSRYDVGRAHGLVHHLTNLDARVARLFFFHLDVFEKLRRDRLQRVGRPLAEPVDRAAVDERRELPKALAERVADGGHAQHHVQVRAALLHEILEKLRHRAVGRARLLRPDRDHVAHLRGLVLREQVGHLAGVQNVVDVLQETFELDLRVVEQKHRGFPLPARFPEHALQVFVPLEHAVRLRDGDAVHRVLGHVRRDPRQRLPSGPADADEERVPEVLTNDARDPADVLGGVEKEDQVHSRLGLLVVIHQLLLDDGEEIGNVEHLRVGLVALDEVREHELAEFDDVDNAVIVRVEVREHLVELQPAVLVDHLANEIEKPQPVLVVHEPVVKHAQILVRPQPDELRDVLRRRAHHGHALPHLGYVAHVVRVVRLGRRRQKLSLDRVVNLQRRLDERRRLPHDLGRELRAVSPPLHDRGVHARERRVVEIAHGYRVEVAKQTRGDRVPPAAGRTHRRGELNVHELAHDELASVVPPAVIHELPQEFYRRLRAVLLELRHVQVVDEDDRFRPERRAEDAFASLVELPVDDVLDLVRVRLRAKRAADARPLAPVLRIQSLLDVHRLPRTRGAAEEDVLAVAIPHRVHGGHDDVLKVQLRVQRLRLRRLQPRAPAHEFFVEEEVVHRPGFRRGERFPELLRGRRDRQPWAEVKVLALLGLVHAVFDERAEKVVKLDPPSRLRRAAYGPYRREQERAVDKVDLMLLLDLARLGFELVDHALEDVHQREREVDVRRRNQLFAVLSNEPHARLDEPGE